MVRCCLSRSHGRAALCTDMCGSPHYAMFVAVVIGPEQPWKAAGGLLAAGFWAYDWTYSDVSGYLR